MKPNELDALIEDCLEGCLSETDATKLSTLLEQSVEARARYWEAASIHGLLEHTMQQASLRVITGEASPKVTRWQQWRPLTAAAAGIMFGMFCTSVVFGYVAQRAAVKRTPLPVFDSSFEGMKPLDKGLPHNADEWGVQSARMVTAENEVRPLQGQHMLRMEPILLGEQDENRYSHACQVLDLRSLPSEAASGTMEVQVTASFCALPSAVKARYIIRVIALNQPPETATEDVWSKADDAGVVSLKQRFVTVAGDSGWHAFSVKMPLPPGAQSLVIILSATSPKDETIPAPVRYLDDVQVSLLTSPTLQP